MSGTHQLTLETLHKLSPDLAEDFREQLQAAVLDCQQRPSLSQKREVTIRLIIRPHSADADDVEIIPVTTRRTPPRNLQPIRARRTHQHQLQFDFDEEE